MTYLEQKDVAWQILNAIVDGLRLDCVDNHRVGLVGDQYDEALYQSSVDSGCCGYYDKVVSIGGELWRIGCNYGH